MPHSSSPVCPQRLIVGPNQAEDEFCLRSSCVVSAFQGVLKTSSQPSQHEGRLWAALTLAGQSLTLEGVIALSSVSPAHTALTLCAERFLSLGQKEGPVMLLL